MQKNRNRIYLLTFLFLSTYLNANDYSCKGDKPFLKDKSRGWFVAEVPCKKPKEDKQKKEEKKIEYIFLPPKQDKEEPTYKPYKDENGVEYKYINAKVNIPWNELDKLHPDTLKELEEANRKVALTYPTMENIVKFKRYQKYLTKKAIKFSQVSTIASKQNSVLANWAAEVPTSRIQLTQKRKYRESKVKKTFAKLKDNLILLIGDSKTCPFCAKQREVLKLFEERYDLSYKLVDIAKNPAFAKKMKIQRTPDLFILFRENNNSPQIVRIGTGLHTVTEIRDNVLIGLQTIGKIDKELAFRWGVKNEK